MSSYSVYVSFKPSPPLDRLLKLPGLSLIKILMQKRIMGFYIKRPHLYKYTETDIILTEEEWPRIKYNELPLNILFFYS